MLVCLALCKSSCCHFYCSSSLRIIFPQFLSRTCCKGAAYPSHAIGRTRLYISLSSSSCGPTTPTPDPPLTLDPTPDLWHTPWPWTPPQSRDQLAHARVLTLVSLVSRGKFSVLISNNVMWVGVKEFYCTVKFLWWQSTNNFCVAHSSTPVAAHKIRFAVVQCWEWKPGLNYWLLSDKILNCDFSLFCEK